MSVKPDSESRRLLMVSTKEAASGAPMALLRLAAGLSEAGWGVQAAFLYHQTPVDRADYPSISLLAQPPAGLRDHLRIVKALIRLIKSERPAALICFLPYASIVGSVIARLYGIKVRVVSLRVPRSTYSRGMRVLDMLAAWTGFYTDVVAVSRGVAASCRAYPARLRKRLSVVYNGLRDWRGSALSTAQARAHFGVAQGQVAVVAVGRLEPQKNHRLLIDAAARVQSDYLLLIAGEGEMRPDIEKQIRELGLTERIRLLGGVSRTSVADLLAAADLFAQPSLFEGQSNALLEAMSAGVPCLVGAVPEQIETVTAGDGKVAGAVLPLDEPERWARAIDSFAGNPHKRAQTRLVVSQQAAKFTFAKMIAGFEQALTNAAAPQQRRDK